MVRLSTELLLVTVKVTVIVEESVKATDALAIFRLAGRLTFGICPVLNSNPAGVFTTRATFAPTANSPLPFSASVIAPRLVQEGTGAAAALSAEIVPPPVAAVRVKAWTFSAAARRRAAIKRKFKSRLVRICIGIMSASLQRIGSKENRNGTIGAGHD